MKTTMKLFSLGLPGRPGPVGEKGEGGRPGSPGFKGDLGEKGYKLKTNWLRKWFLMQTMIVLFLFRWYRRTLFGL